MLFMTDKNIVAGKWALVTGGSSGLGVDFARELAGRGMNLILVARREEKLAAVREELIDEYGVEVEVLSRDLSGQDAPRQLYEELEERGLEIEVLINNAGFGLYGKFQDQELDHIQDMIDLNVRTLTTLTHLVLPEMLERGSGYVLQVASNAAYQPSPGYAAYGGTKSYVHSFSQAVSYELRDTPVRMTVVSPGPTRTEFHEVSSQGRDNWYIQMQLMPSEKVARIGVQALFRGKSGVVPGWFNASAAWLAQRLPRRWAAALAGWTMGV
jgi:short-subunit dehydrogenase